MVTFILGPSMEAPMSANRKSKWSRQMTAVGRQYPFVSSNPDRLESTPERSESFFITSRSTGEMRTLA